jgi:hypothetical protein
MGEPPSFIHAIPYGRRGNPPAVEHELDRENDTRKFVKFRFYR